MEIEPLVKNNIFYYTLSSSEACFNIKVITKNNFHLIFLVFFSFVRYW